MNSFKFPKYLLALSVIVFAFTGTMTYGQQTTERYIPIGQSPGVSDKYSYIGEIVAVDASAHSIVVESNRGRRTVAVTSATRIWLDKTTAKQSNTVGSYDDCEVGRRVEVMHVRDDEAVADWIKIEAP